ncbi:MAG: adenylate/guanylate cyclase domain-containing protein [Candidatus Eremiobacteraeota bacterium]|nr:adenylate/guanylate cyclase domain-containing protein [Candidatus Eremiobacteraeota bacterium]
MLALLLGAAGVLAAWLTSRKLLAERGELRRVRALFSRYVPIQVVDDLLARKDPRLFEAREYYATIVSCRIRGFALIAERVTPEETLRYLNEFYTLVGGAVERHHGMIESLRGDTVTAIFGVLVEERFQEERALRAALDAMRLSDAMDERRRSQGRKSLGVSVGVNSGKVIAGDTGYQLRRDFAIVGNPAHVAERLQLAADELNATIVASATTYEAVRDLFVGIPTSSIPLRGLKRLQNAYIIRGLAKRAAEDALLKLRSREVLQADRDPFRRGSRSRRGAGSRRVLLAGRRRDGARRESARPDRVHELLRFRRRSPGHAHAASARRNLRRRRRPAGPAPAVGIVTSYPNRREI